MTSAIFQIGPGRSTPRPDDHVIVLLGATGDLARRKLLPGLFHLSAVGLLPDGYRIVGSARRPLTDEQFREHARQAVAEFGTGEPASRRMGRFQPRPVLRQRRTGQHGPAGGRVQRADEQLGGSPRRLIHLAIPPGSFEATVAMLAEAGLTRGARVIIEKPFGTDLRSAQALNQAVHAVFDESQIFRIDHFLGKESVDNILALRFANGLFEPVWNRRHIRYVQIDVPEALSIEGRADFYDATGAYRDMIVTHLFQVLGVVAMERPESLDAGHLRDQMVSVFDAVRPIDVRHVVRGQYRGYRGEPGVKPHSDTETMAAVRAEVDNSRWAGVPFLLRSGKSLAASRQLVTLGFHQPPLQMFGADGQDAPAGLANEITIDFADPGSITAGFLAKEPGAAMRLGPATMTFSYRTSFCVANGLEGYERLILDAMLGDQALFTRADGVERLWEISAQLLDNPPPAEPYAPGSWGPGQSLARLAAPFRWHLPEAGETFPNPETEDNPP